MIMMLYLICAVVLLLKLTTFCVISLNLPPILNINHYDIFVVVLMDGNYVY